MENVLAYSLLTIFLVLLPNLSLVDARKLEISNSVFSVDLVHRHSIHSPYYNSSLTRRERYKRAPLGSISHGHKIHLSPKHYDKKDAKLLDLIADGGEYFIRFTLGTPPVEQFAIADTGSSLIWVQCTPCVFCIPQKSPFFNPTNSLTFRAISCASKACTNNRDFSPISCPVDQNNNLRKNSLPCLYFASYGDGTKSIGNLATDTIGLPSLDATYQTLPFSIIGCGFYQNSTEHPPILGEGIIGLGAGPSSLISQLGPKVNYKFSYCLAPPTSGVTSKLNFGADIKGPTIVSTPFTIDNPPTYYHLTLNGITIRPSKGNPIKIHMPERLDIIIDSGSTLTYLPQSVFDGVTTAVASAIKVKPVIDPNNGLCYKTHNRKFIPPDAVFHFKGAEVVLKAYNTFWEVDDEFSCLAMASSAEPPFIFGNIAQVNFHVGYDLQAKQVSFAPTDCANH